MEKNKPRTNCYYVEGFIRNANPKKSQPFGFYIRIENITNYWTAAQWMNAFKLPIFQCLKQEFEDRNPGTDKIFNINPHDLILTSHDLIDSYEGSPESPAENKRLKLN